MNSLIVFENSVLFIYLNNEEAPWIYQPTHPSGKKWESQEEAESWAQSLINSLIGLPEQNNEVIEELLLDSTES